MATAAKTTGFANVAWSSDRTIVGGQQVMTARTETALLQSPLTDSNR
jgi:hypothetical protein